MSIVVNGSGTITGISQGGLNDNIITQSELANTGVAGNGPAFSAYASATQNVSNATFVKIQYNIEDFDTNSNYDTSNYRFTPTVAGYYQVTGRVGWSAGLPYAQLWVYKNGAQYVCGDIGVTANSNSSCVASLVYMNGSTDYIELYAYQASGSTPTAGGGSTMKFQAVLVRAA